MSEQLAFTKHLAFDRQRRKADRREGQVAASGSDLLTADIAHDARSASHIGDLRFRMAWLVILQVEWRVKE